MVPYSQELQILVLVPVSATGAACGCAVVVTIVVQTRVCASRIERAWRAAASVARASVRVNTHTITYGNSQRLLWIIASYREAHCVPIRAFAWALNQTNINSPCGLLRD